MGNTMGVLSSLFNKIKQNKEKADSLCEKIDNFTDGVRTLIDGNDEFIENSFALTVSGELEKLKEKTSELSGKKIREKERTLEEFSRKIEEYIQIHNDNCAVRRETGTRKMLGTVEGRQLDSQQIQCIAKPLPNHLVIAGAGTGKTTTVVGKVKYLLKTKEIRPEQILVLSFTNVSAAEMRERIHKETGEDIEVSTFHKLGLNILKATQDRVPNISRINLNTFAREQLEINMQDPYYLDLICSYFYNNPKYACSEFDFKNAKEYEEYLTINPPMTMRGEKVKSYGEMDIANFLYRNGISYTYERPYVFDTRTAKHAQYYPDFYLNDYDIYIEYFGINEKGQVPSYFKSRDGEDPSEEYRRSINWKRELHRTKGTVMIECFAYERMRGELLSLLEKKLRERNVELRPIPASEIWRNIEENNSGNPLTGIAELMGTIITLIKSNDYTMVKDGERSFIKLSDSEGGRLLNMKSVALELAYPIYEEYQRELKKNDEIDFNDMINKATHFIKKGDYTNPYGCIIVDEYQDISKARFNLLKALRESFYYKIFCVGDDWQSIYRFTGSDLDYILNFSKYWGATEVSMIETTYRFSGSMIDVSGRFIMKNSAQIKKNIIGKTVSSEIPIEEIKGYNDNIAVKFMVDKLKELPLNSSVFFIGRYTFDSRLLSECKELVCKYDNASQRAIVICPERQDLKMEFLTAHKTKGLQADYVFIINNKDRGMGFPSKIQDDPIVEALLESKEKFPYAEERRLFYVAITRAKIKTFLLGVQGNESCFLKEIEKEYIRELKKQGLTCPLCGGRLEKRRGAYGEFYGCSNYKTSGCKYTRSLKEKQFKE